MYSLRKMYYFPLFVIVNLRNESFMTDIDLTQASLKCNDWKDVQIIWPNVKWIYWRENSAKLSHNDLNKRTIETSVQFRSQVFLTFIGNFPKWDKIKSLSQRDSWWNWRSNTSRVGSKGTGFLFRQKQKISFIICRN